MRRSPRKRRQETRRLAIACAQEDTESEEDETYLSAATNMQKEVRLYSFTDFDDEIILYYITYSLRTVTKHRQLW